MSNQQPSPPSHRSRLSDALVLAWALALSAEPALGQSAAAPAPAKSPVAQVSAPPAWNTLSAAQQTALQPLAPIWTQISSNRKRKWIALSARFSKLTAAEQATLHGRMAEWATLSNIERNRARLNFTETRSLSSEEKKIHWDSYQALSPTQKQQLARQAANRAPLGAAPAVAAGAQGKLAAVPVTRSEAGAAKTRSPAGQAVAPAAGASAATPMRP